MSRWIFSYKCILCKAFNNFSVPDVAFVVMPIVYIVSLVVFVSIAVPEHDEHNKVDFVCISIWHEFTQTLH